jgi:hypothetical protein
MTEIFGGVWPAPRKLIQAQESWRRVSAAELSR